MQLTAGSFEASDTIVPLVQSQWHSLVTNFSSFQRQTQLPELVQMAPDGGWGWLVVFASFMIHAVADGVAYTL